MRTIKEAFALNNNRGPGFDTLRLLAATAVVLHHARRLNHDIVHDSLFYFSNGYTQLGLLAVSVFFALSGFLVTPGLLKSGDVIEYLSRRFMRITPLLAVVVVVTAMILGAAMTSLSLADYYGASKTWLYLKNVTTSLSLTLPGVVAYDGSRNINDPMWTLRFEWISYFVLAGASLVGLLRKRTLFLAAWLAAMLFLLVHYGAVPEGDQRKTLFVVIYLFSFFGAGTLMFLFSDILPTSALLTGLATGALVFVLWANLAAALILAPLLIAYVVTSLGLVRFPWSRMLQNHDLSYGVYVTHAVILTVLQHYFSFKDWPPLFVATLLLSYLTAFLTWTFIERPALQHKSLPADIFKRLTGRNIAARHSPIHE